MANLQLAVKGEYFDAMIRGEKTEEYRLCNDYWNKRIMFREYDRLIITKGYPKRHIAFRYLLSLTEPKLFLLSNSSLDGIGFTRWRIIISAGRMPGLYASPLMVNSSVITDSAIA
jgi:hypothetical protein